MPSAPETLVEARLASQRGRLLEWLVDAAYPLWATHGVDRRNGGFVEALDASGRPLALPRRARVQPRQVYAFAAATRLGWRGDARAIVQHGLDYLTARYRRADGFFRTLIAADGKVLDDRALLYDQAFVLLGLASAATALDAGSQLEPLALALRAQVERCWRVAGGEFLSGEPEPDPREANPHMHLLEACLAWSGVGADPGWADWVDELADVALRRLINPSTGALAEAFTASWGPAPGTAGRIVEPGHQYEWAWLLLNCVRRDRSARRAAALRLIDVAERHGVRGGVAVNTLLDDFEIHDPAARLWPQTERLRAAVLASRVTGDARYTAMAADAASGVFQYLDTKVPGLWLDLRHADGTYSSAPAYASTFYHLVGAIAALESGGRRDA